MESEKMKLQRFKINTNTLFWLVFIALLISMLKHTAWAFDKFEQLGDQGWGGLSPWAWLQAFAFEMSIAVFVHKLAERINHTPNYTAGRVGLRTFSFRYINPFSAGLVVSLCVSALAQFAHAAEFERPLKVFADYQISPIIYLIAFGAVLPLASLVFAAALSNVNESEQESNGAELKLKRELSKVKRDLRIAEDQLKNFRDKAKEGEFLFSDNKADRINALKQFAPDASNKAIAEISGASDAYVSEVLKRAENEVIRPVLTGNGHAGKVGEG